MSEKKKVKFTIVDAVVVVVLVAIIAFVGLKLTGIYPSSDPNDFSSSDNENGDSKEQTYIVSYYFEEVPDFAAKRIKTGDPVTDEVRLHSLGKVTDVEIGPSASYNADSNGVIKKSSKEGYSSVLLSTEVKGSKYKHGVEISKAYYVVGHSMTIYAGGAKMYGKVCSVEKK